MANGRLPRIAAIGGALIFALVCSGCGRRGALEAPPVVTAPSGDQAATDQNKPKRPHRTPSRPPTEPFILDPLV